MNPWHYDSVWQFWQSRTSLLLAVALERSVLLFITAVPNIKLFAWGKVDSGLLRGRVRVCVFFSAVPITKLFACGQGNRGGHVLRDL